MDNQYHPQCFVCAVGHPIGFGSEFSSFYYHDSQILCAEHFESLILPTCSACDCIIRGTHYKTDDDEEYHVECWENRLKLKAKSGVTKGLPQGKLAETGTREIGRAVQQECRDRSRMPSSA
eukprot:TRINITY_DN5487_c1_g1_i1.p1 TRINITY_DN5487_c1_g1~~TRINITY_DN5487_c1_g1_i1.p1  ORF type:complete len:121 (-),score=6.17 TRINITY_DN5487_c1_g1_i1:11-373(-)